MIRSSKKEFGFNLLEVVIAGFLFSTIAIAFLGVWGLQVRSVEKSRHTLVATMLAEQLIEETMSAGYELTQVTEGEPEIVPLLIQTESRSPSGEWASIDVTYRTSVEVAPVGSEDDKLKQVIVRVNWDDTTKTGEIVLETYLAGVF